MNLPAAERAIALLLVIFGSRVWARWRTAKRQRVKLVTPLVDAAVLEAVFHPRLRDGDDVNLLAELRDTFAHLNRQAYAEEFWGVGTHMETLYASLGETQQATMRRALVRLVTASDRWLQMVGARTAAALDVQEAVPPLRALLELGDTQTFSQDASALPTNSDKRYRQELETALMSLSGSPA